MLSFPLPNLVYGVVHIDIYLYLPNHVDASPNAMQEVKDPRIHTFQELPTAIVWL